jgi:hypothetical protein
MIKEVKFEPLAGAEISLSSAGFRPTPRDNKM